MSSLTPKKSETIQFRYDPEKIIKFRKICENTQISFTDQIKILIEDFSKNYIFLMSYILQILKLILDKASISQTDITLNFLMQ